MTRIAEGRRECDGPHQAFFELPLADGSLHRHVYTAFCGQGLTQEMAYDQLDDCILKFLGDKTGDLVWRTRPHLELGDACWIASCRLAVVPSDQFDLMAQEITTIGVMK